MLNAHLAKIAPAVTNFPSGKVDDGHQQRDDQGSGFAICGHRPGETAGRFIDQVDGPVGHYSWPVFRRIIHAMNATDPAATLA
jgi:hypothetical protein